MTLLSRQAWAAGFIEADGHIGVTANGTPILRVSQKRRAPLDALANLFGGTVVYCRQRYHVRSLWAWNTEIRTRIQTCLTAILPHMQSKQRVVMLVLNLLNLKRFISKGKRPPPFERALYAWYSKQVKAENHSDDRK